jgi:hypothetical protein
VIAAVATPTKEQTFMTMIEEQFRDVMRRTMRNLEIIEQASLDAGEAYELAQLMNSF